MSVYLDSFDGGVQLHRHDHAPDGDEMASMLSMGANVWYAFTTEHGSKAWAAYSPETPVFLLHDVASERKGDGTALMEAVGKWADQRRVVGVLVCWPEIAGFYQRFGWVVASTWLGMVELVRTGIVGGAPEFYASGNWARLGQQADQ